MPAWIEPTALAEILDADFDSLDEDRLYRVRDKLHPHRAAIEAELVARERSLFDLDTTIYLYGLTSTYLEGLCAHNAKAQRCHSSDHRPNCKRVVIGLVVNREAYPLPMKSLPAIPSTARRQAPCPIGCGNAVAWPKLLPWSSTAAWPLTKTSPNSRPAICFTSLPVASQSASVGSPALRTRRRHASAAAAISAQKKSAVAVKTRVDGDVTYLLCRSEQEVAKDRAIRRKHQAHLRGDLEKLTKRVADKRARRS
jgi:hypothetical protein